MLSVAHVNKGFSGVHALKDVSIAVDANEVVGLVGENGAGKSTLMRILAGVYQPDSGTLKLDGKAITLSSPREANASGIGIVFQEQSLLTNLSVAENIYLGQERHFSRFGLINRPSLIAAARRQLSKVQVDIDPRVRTSQLTFAARQMVELAKALALEERTEKRLIILLDEPTSVLEQREIDVLFSRVRALKSRASFVFVSHRLDEVLALSDRVYVMKDGKVVTEKRADTTSVPELHQLMVGRDLHAEYYRESKQIAPQKTAVIEAQNLSVAGAYHHVDFRVHKGEVLGIAGVIGSGREELTRTLFGFLPQTSGTLSINGRKVRLSSPSQAADLGMGYLPRERRVEGLVLPLSITLNITLAKLSTVLERGSTINLRRERQLAESWVGKLHVRTRNIDTLCMYLSGGNQQKVVL
ncbi:MAG: sugar ABC transporter ATP-binding protein, partial [Verrucomicrobia bacterium]|nr:sugar ABC transporter ATP-binding protein [Verrucomicrobiota bacterium]